MDLDSLDSVVAVLISVLMGLATLALITRIISKRGVAILGLLWLFFCVIHPRLRERILSTVAPLIGAVLPLILILLALRIIIRGKVR